MTPSIRIPLATALGLAALAAGPAPAQEMAVARTVDSDALDWGPCPGFMPEGCGIAVLHGNPAEPNADIFYRVPGGAEIPRHWHTSPERMVLVEGEMSVTYDGQDPVTLAPGTYGYGPARKPHSADCLSDGPCTLFIAFVAPIDAMADAPD
ncbi:cupin domain-containing protein [Psychromarinibacter sp. C21-152]|uniref:Cupin domain-containing protein n=1 Tax=Psychromarinibacter sediminicola TaxID=3033385 RepID=A0AAE3T6T9_9RHOB|nr:cupin domain-containing protein [Psychromarinibacter sediminicola]MDF0599660.1 cupin domain-containing protein [Psychromarinibacter sediminicola]